MSADPTALVRSLLPALAPAELADLLRLIERSRDGAADGGEFIALLRRDDRSTAFKTAAGFVQSRRRALDAAPADGRDGERAAARLALGQLQALVSARLVDAGGSLPAADTPARPVAAGADALLPELADGPFILRAHETILGRPCRPPELRAWQQALERGQATRAGLVAALFAASVHEEAAAHAHGQAHDGRSFHVLGTGQKVTAADWQARAAAVAQQPAPATEPAPARFAIAGPPRPLVTAIASLYRGGRWIERFLQNITGQSCFRDYAELVIVDADSPEGEQTVIARYVRQFPNIRYLRINHRIGIYAAWNIAVAQARGEYLSSTSVDDLRRHDSLERQAGALDQLPFADVVYQDFFYSLDPALDFARAAQMGFRARPPLVTPCTLLACNPPHNAPMWRRRLHDELGLFDERYQSAGDYEFWLRCLAAGKRFHRLDDPHVVYFQNPDGLSTRPGTRGFDETREIIKRHGGRLIAPPLLASFDEFCAAHTPGVPATLDDGSQDRLRQVRRALRQAARTRKYAAAALMEAA